MSVLDATLAACRLDCSKAMLACLFVGNADRRALIRDPFEVETRHCEEWLDGVLTDGRTM